MIDAATFSNTVNLIIDNLEGGYYHPQMLKDGRVTDPRYAASGETMFGMDRLNGGSINTSDAGQKFWALIDNADAKDTWPWDYMGGSLQPQLRTLTAQMMLPEYTDLSNRYLSPETQALIESDARLLFNFVYAAWNGPGWFQQFAQKMNDAVGQGVTDTTQLTNIAVDARTQSGNSLISQGGTKIASLVSTINPTINPAVEAVKAEGTAVLGAIKANPMVAAFGGLMITMAGLLFFYYVVGVGNSEAKAA